MGKVATAHKKKKPIKKRGPPALALAHYIVDTGC